MGKQEDREKEKEKILTVFCGSNIEEARVSGCLGSS